MVVGKDVAGGVIGADDETGTGHGVFNGLAPHVGGHVAVDAHHRLQVGGVHLFGGEDGLAVHVGQGHGGGTGALVNGGGVAAEAVDSPHAAAAHRAADDGAAQANGNELTKAALLLFLGGYGVIHMKLIGLYDGVAVLGGPVIITVIHKRVSPLPADFAVSFERVLEYPVIVAEL